MRKLTIVVAILILSISEGLSSQLILGLNIKQIYVWRYWKYETGNLHERIIILNEDSVATTLHFRIVKVVDNGLRIHTTRDSLSDSSSGTWTINAHGYIDVDAPSFVVNSGNYLLSIQKDEKLGGLLYLSTPKPIYSRTQSKLLTTQGINVSGGNSSPNISWEHESPTLKSGRHARVLLKIKPLPNQEQTIEITNWPDSVLNRRRSFSNININEVSLKADTSISVSEKNPNVKAEKLKYTIPPATTDSSYNHEYTIEFDIQAPKVSNPTMVFLSVFYFYYKTNGGTFYLPYVVIP